METKRWLRTAVSDSSGSPTLPLSIVSRWRGVLMGLAALWIFYFHDGVLLFAFQSGPFPREVEWFVQRMGFMGVDIFFLLSGMGLYHSLSKKPSLGAFYMRRFTRVYPAFLLTGVAFALLYRWSFSDFLLNVTCINFWMRSVHSLLWFVPAILFLYLISPLYYRVYARSSHPLTFTAAIIAGLFCLTLATQHVLRADLFGFFNRIPIFLVGFWFGDACARNVVVQKKPLRLTLIVTALACTVLLWWMNATDTEFFQDSRCYFHLPLAVSLSLLLSDLLEHWLPAERPARKSRVLVPVLSFYGGISLELYCVQTVVKELVDGWTDFALIPSYYLRSLAAMLVYLALSTLLAVVLQRVCRLLVQVVSSAGSRLRKC